VLPLLGWLDRPSTDHGIRFAGPGDEWEFWSYDRLERASRRVAAGLLRAGIDENDAVGVAYGSTPEFVAGLFGTMLAGATPSPIAPPMPLQPMEPYRDHLTGILHSLRPAVMLAEERLHDLLRQAKVPGHPLITSIASLTEDLGDDGEPPPADSARLALRQFTSGSSGRARCVEITHGALRANVAAIRTWLRWTSEDSVASWLPVHHDMGLIGCLIAPVVSRSNLWLLPPEEFIRHPLRYLRCFGTEGAQLTAMPNFGLDHIAHKVPPEELAGMDFSRWRAVIVGAEHLDHGSFDRFHNLLAGRGLPRRSLRPAYGLAEATLAVTGLPLDEEWTGVCVEPGSLALGEPVTLSAHPDSAHPDVDQVVVVGCGRPLRGFSVTVAGKDGDTLPAGRIGEITVVGDSLAAGYLGDRPDAATRFAGGTLHTGDAGFVLDGQLFVLGRLGDSMKIRGRAVFAEDLEAALRAPGIPVRRVAAAMGSHAGVPTVVLVLEHAKPHWLKAARSIARKRTEGARLILLDVPRGAIPRTTSGKVRRHEIWRRYTAGELDRLDRTGREAG
jgi:acyl-CoA synthetase (AMP-forming)/AMP-acid ligase II